MSSIRLCHFFTFCFIVFFLSCSNRSYATNENASMLYFTQSLSATRPSNLRKCIYDKYQDYTQASLSWYKSIAKATVKQDPTLNELTHLFLDNRKKYAVFNLTIFSYYLNNFPEKLDLNAPVESWLNLDQAKLKNILTSNTELTPLAKEFEALKEKNSDKNNYKLRAAFAELLSRPANMQIALNIYNKQIQAINQSVCPKEK